MDLLFAPEEQAFRTEVRDFLKEHLPPELAAKVKAGQRLTREKTLSAAKYSIGKIGTLLAEECIQLHGGIGMTWELPLTHYAKRLVMIDHQLGDMGLHLARWMTLGRQSH